MVENFKVKSVFLDNLNENNRKHQICKKNTEEPNIYKLIWTKPCDHTPRSRKRPYRWTLVLILHISWPIICHSALWWVRVTTNSVQPFNKHCECGFGKLKASRADSCRLEGPKLVLLGQQQRQPHWTPGCWLWTFASFLFMEILPQRKNKKITVVPKRKVGICKALMTESEGY